VHWPLESACAACAAELAAHPAIADSRIELAGPLGAGKTTFVRHLLRALGVEGRIKSPSYAVVELYDVQRHGRSLAISHFDFYRFSDPREWEDAGLRELYAQAGLKLVEWADKAAPLLPVPDLRLQIEPRLDGSRAVLLQACSARGLELLG
jgi:tRNA threonylcarbamoyladenosine biosynthesis protein TsaE